MRSTFSLSQTDSDRIEAIRAAFAKNGHMLNKSEVIRLALICLEAGAPQVQTALVRKLARLRPGRPPKEQI
jgi:hypothetical protein